MRTTVYIHGGDYDCSEAVRMCYRAADVLPYGSHMWTGNEVALLTSHGFVQRSLGSPQVGDVLWRDGHTEMYLGDGRQGGARHGDAAGGLTGRKGDQGGTEVARSAYRASDWSMLLRYEGGKTCDGIPAAIVAARVMDHIIDHEAHGYSQPNRAGDGTIEEVTVTWSAPAPPKLVKCTFWFRADGGTPNIRTHADMEESSIVGTLKAGRSVKCDGWCINDGRMWAHYVYKGADRYLSLGSANSWVVVK